jgi:hypothetical protein
MDYKLKEQYKEIERIKTRQSIQKVIVLSGMSALLSVCLLYIGNRFFTDFMEVYNITTIVPILVVIVAILLVAELLVFYVGSILK